MVRADLPQTDLFGAQSGPPLFIQLAKRFAEDFDIPLAWQVEPGQQPQQGGSARHIKAIEGVFQKIGAREQLGVVLQRRREQQLRRVLGDVGPVLEMNQT